jgi:hypothetical protein
MGILRASFLAVALMGVLSAIPLKGSGQVLITLIFGDKLNSPGLEFGLEGGVNIMQITGLQSPRALPRFNLGFYFDIRLKNQWYLYTGVLVKSGMGSNKLTYNDLIALESEIIADGGTFSQRLESFIVPVLIRRRIFKLGYIEAGPQLAYVYDGFIRHTYSDGDIDFDIQENNRDQLNRIDAGFVLGAGFRLREGVSPSFGVKYYFGLTEVYQNVSGYQNRGWFMKAHFPIGATKAKANG